MQKVVKEEVPGWQEPDLNKNDQLPYWCCFSSLWWRVTSGPCFIPSSDYYFVS